MAPRTLSPFIDPASPVLATAPPLEAAWVHEIKWGGYRMQLQKAGDRVRIFNRNGQDCTHRYLRIVEAAATLPTFSAILDCELVAMGKQREDFWGIRSRHAQLQLVYFDLMLLEGEDLRALPLIKRRAKLKRLVGKATHPMICYSEHFADPLALLADAETHGLEGIVSKRGDLPYRSGYRCGWKKVKTPAWLKANANRPDAFPASRKAR